MFDICGGCLLHRLVLGQECPAKRTSTLPWSEKGFNRYECFLGVEPDSPATMLARSGPKSRRPWSNCIVCAVLVLSPHRTRSNRACQKELAQKGSHNDCNQEDAFSFWLVSHSK